MQQPVRKYFAHRPRRDPGIGVKIQHFSEHCYVAYQIREITNAATL